MIAAAKVVHSGAQQGERIIGAEYYRPDVDGLRGIAVLAVVGFHAFPDHFPGGFFGVDVFFVVSGFLISSILLRQLRRSTFTFAQFYARRIRRIFPALVVVLAASFLFGAFALLPHELAELGKHLAAAAAFVSNFTLWQESGYFDVAAELKPLLHLWSLGVEEQFYLLWPMLLLLLWKYQQRNVAASILVLTLGSFAVSIALARHDPVANFYFPFSRFWELGVGCLLAVVKESPESVTRWFGANPRLPAFLRSARSHSLLTATGIGLIAAAILFVDPRAFSGWTALLPTLGAICIISAAGDSWLQRRVMASNALVLIGLISYPLYLWHWPLLSFATILTSGTAEVGTRVAAVALSAVLAWLTFKFVERPIRTRRSMRDTMIVSVVLLILGGTGFIAYSAAGFPNRFELDLQAIRPGPRTNSLCTSNFPEEAHFNYCKSTSAERPQALVLGDSRAQAVYDAVVELTEGRHPMTLLGRGGCPPLLNVDLHYLDEEGCMDAWREFASYAAQVEPAVVVLVGGGSTLLDPAESTLGPESAHFASRQIAFEHGLRQLIAALQQHSRVIYVLEFPLFPSAPACFLRPITLPGSACSPTAARSSVEASMARYKEALLKIQAELPQLQIVDSIGALCSSSVCSQKLGSGEIIYSDEVHLSPVGGRYFARSSGLLIKMFP